MLEKLLNDLRRDERYKAEFKEGDKIFLVTKECFEEKN